MASKIFSQHQQLHKQLTQEQVKNELVNQAYFKMVQEDQERVGNAESKEFILNRGNITAT